MQNTDLKVDHRPNDSVERTPASQFMRREFLRIIGKAIAGGALTLLGVSGCSARNNPSETQEGRMLAAERDSLIEEYTRLANALRFVGDDGERRWKVRRDVDAATLGRVDAFNARIDSYNRQVRRHDFHDERHGEDRLPLLSPIELEQ